MTTKQEIELRKNVKQYEGRIEDLREQRDRYHDERNVWADRAREYGELMVRLHETLANLVGKARRNYLDEGDWKQALHLLEETRHEVADAKKAMQS